MCCPVVYSKPAVYLTPNPAESIQIRARTALLMHISLPAALPANQRSRNVRGPQTALITYLLELGWQTTSVSSWDLPTADDQFETWNFDEKLLTFLALQRPKALLDGPNG